MIVVIGNDYLVNGLRMGGVDKGIVVSNIEEFEEKVEEYLNDSIDILILPEAMLDKANWRIKKKIDEIAKPVVVTLPDINAKYESSRLKELIKRALGFDLIR